GVVLATLVGLADLVFQVSLGRPLNLFIDLYLVGAVWDLAVGNLGRVPALAALLGLLLVLSLASFGLARLLAPVRSSRGGRGPRPEPHPGPRMAGAALLGLFALGAIVPPAAVRAGISAPIGRLVRS